MTRAEHDPLRYYTAALSTADWLVFGNGEQVADPHLADHRTARRDGGRTAVLGAARPSSASRLSTNIMTLTVQGLEPGEAVLKTTYHSDGQTVLAATPFEETTITAQDGTELLGEIWSALNPEFRIAAAVLDPGQGPAGAVLRSACSPLAGR